jgi:PDZ domain
MVALLCVVASLPLAALAQPRDDYAPPRRGWMGVATDPASDSGSQGVRVVDVLAGSPAAAAGLHPGDQIVAVNGRPIGTYAELSHVVTLPPGTVLRLSVRRGNRIRELTVTLGAPPNSLPAPNGPRVRPGDTSPQDTPTRSNSPSNPYDADEDDEDDGGDSRGNGSRYQTSNNDGYARGNADARDSCSQVCRRGAECNALSFQYCAKLCTGAAKSGHVWRVDPHATCEDVRKAFVTDAWVCSAQASAGSAMGNMPYVYENVSALGTGRSRAEAANQAVKDCNSLVGVHNSLSWGEGETVNSGMCQIARCSPPGTPLSQAPR